MAKKIMQGKMPMKGMPMKGKMPMRDNPMDSPAKERRERKAGKKT